MSHRDILLEGCEFEGYGFLDSAVVRENTTARIQDLFCNGKKLSKLDKGRENKDFCKEISEVDFLNGTNATLVAEHGSKPAFFVGNTPYTLLRPICSVFSTINSVKTINFGLSSTKGSVYFIGNLGS